MDLWRHRANSPNKWDNNKTRQAAILLVVESANYSHKMTLVNVFSDSGISVCYYKQYVN